MASKKSISPTWREHLARAGSYRAAFSFDPERIKHPSAGWVAMFQDEFGMADADFQRPRSQGDAPVSLGDRPGMDPQHRTAIAQIVGEGNVEDDDFSRVRYGHGKSLDENLALRAGRVEAVPDLVVHPRDKADVAAVVAYCAEHAIPVIPYGAGSGVVIGSRADRGGVVLVMRTHMNQILAINERNMTAVVQPGLIGSDFEAELNDAPRLRGTARAYTCGHFPQSFEMASVGGWITALGSGQASTYYGDAYDLIISQEYVTPVGTIRTRDVPAFADRAEGQRHPQGQRGHVRGAGRGDREDLPPPSGEHPALRVHVPALAGGRGVQPGDRPGRVRDARHPAHLRPGGDRARTGTQGLRRRHGKRVPDQAGIQTLAALPVRGHRRRGEGLREDTWPRRPNGSPARTAGCR